eukprot:2554335-Prymnesium_polylepis.1
MARPAADDAAVPTTLQWPVGSVFVRVATLGPLGLPGSPAPPPAATVSTTALASVGSAAPWLLGGFLVLAVPFEQGCGVLVLMRRQRLLRWQPPAPARAAATLAASESHTLALRLGRFGLFGGTQDGSRRPWFGQCGLLLRGRLLGAVARAWRRVEHS